MTYKFRAWDNDEKNMIYFGLHSTDCGYHIMEGKSIDDMPTMQFVGLKDKNNTDIYEADIVKVQFQDYDNSTAEMVDSIGIVTYDTSPFCIGFIVEHISGLNHWYDDSFAWNELEVIGNICQLPQFLSTFEKWSFLEENHDNKGVKEDIMTAREEQERRMATKEKIDFPEYRSGDVRFEFCLEGYTQGIDYYTFAVYKDDELYIIISNDDGMELTFTEAEIHDTFRDTVRRMIKDNDLVHEFAKKHPFRYPLYIDNLLKKILEDYDDILQTGQIPGIGNPV